MIAAFSLLVFVVGAVACVILMRVDRGQRWVERVGGSCALVTLGAGLTLAGSLLFWLGEFLLNHAP